MILTKGNRYEKEVSILCIYANISFDENLNRF